ncbi:MAG TPA: hypothetical protein VF041_08180 [Gemmatimonadaceae bacterium]
MIDILGALFAAAIYVAQVGTLVGFAPARVPAKLGALAIASVWGATVVAVGAVGGFTLRLAGLVPLPVLAFALALAALFGAWIFLPGFRNALLAVPLPALVGLNIARLGGVFFLLLAARDRLSYSFASPAGVGDMIVATLAIPVAIAAVRGAVRGAARVGWIRAWNALGALDLAVAIATGALSAQGTPYRVFSEGPGTAAMTQLPWVLVPAIIVPVYILMHFTIAVKLRAPERVPRAVAVAG